MAFRALRILNDSQVEMTFAADDGTEVVHIFTIDHSDNPDRITVTSGDADFNRKYRRLATPTWPELISYAAWRASRRQLPAGDGLDRLWARVSGQHHPTWGD